MSSENGKTVFEEAAAERELEDLRLAIEETRARRRRANAAFDAFLKGFDEKNRVAEPNETPRDDGLSAFEPAAPPTPAVPVTLEGPADLSALQDFAQEEPFASAPL